MGVGAGGGGGGGGSKLCGQWATQLFMLLNYTSSISIVFLNKLAYSYGFPSITLTMLHFLMTFAGLRVSFWRLHSVCV